MPHRMKWKNLFTNRSNLHYYELKQKVIAYEQAIEHDVNEVRKDEEVFPAQINMECNFLASKIYILNFVSFFHYHLCINPANCVLLA